MTRRALAVVGILLMAYAVTGALTDSAARRPGHVVFLAVVLLGHDLVLLPVALAVGALAARRLPVRIRGPVQGGLFVSAVVAFVGLARPSGLVPALVLIWSVAGVSALVRLGTSPRMRQDNFPHPVSDPEVEGVPEYADPDSTAWGDAGSARVADGSDPAPVPPRDAPLAIDRYGTTAAEAHRGESVDYKLAREDADEPADAADLDDRLVLDDEPVDPHLDSHVSMYDRPDPLLDPGAPVGRLVEPDEGAHTDDEPDAVAYDAGAAGGGPSAEEAAMHEVTEP